MVLTTNAGLAFLLLIAVGTMLVGLGALMGQWAGQICLIIGTFLAGAVIITGIIELTL